MYENSNSNGEIMPPKPVLGLMPKDMYYDGVKTDRFNEVSEAISRYYNAGLKIPWEWLAEYTELVENLNK